VMMWGVAAGLPAGVLGGVFARAVCVPTGVLIGWIAGVARWSSSAPLGQLGMGHVLLLGALVAVGAAIRSRRGRLTLTVAALLVLVQPAMALAAGGRHDWGSEITPGARLWRSEGATVLVVDTARADQLLRAVHGAGVRQIDLLVVARSTRSTSAAVATLLARVPARAVADKAGDAFVGPMVVRIRPAARGVEVQVDRR